VKRKKGYTYIFYDKRTRLTKIGESINPRGRREDLERSYGELDLVTYVFSFDCQKVEKIMHRAYAGKRQSLKHGFSGHTEWFRLNLFDRKKAVLCLHKTAFFLNLEVLGREAIWLVLPLVVILLFVL
jgi:hypothetical protein